MASDGLYIRWRETAPDRGVLDFALSELEALHVTWPETVQCNIVIERAAATLSAHERFTARVQIEVNRRGEGVSTKATGDDPYAALRRAFGDLRHCMPVAPAVAELLAAVAATAPDGEVAA